MPTAVSYPGVYIEEIPSGVHTIASVATSIAAFVGYTKRGIDNRAERILSFTDFERIFGGLASDSELSYAVRQFFENGGSEAYVVRVPKSSDDTAAAAPEVKSASATITLVDENNNAALTVTALSRGAWANDIIIDVDYDGIADGDTDAFNLNITDRSTSTTEPFPNVTMDPSKSNFVKAVVNDADSGSKMISVDVAGTSPGRPVSTGTTGGVITLSDIKNDKDYSLKISSDLPAGKISSVLFTFIAKGESIPGSVLGLCRLLERKANAALKAVPGVTGASIRCTPIITSTGQAIRVCAEFSQDDLPNTLDAGITFAAGTPDSALAALKLSSASATANVSHYWLGLGRTALSQKGAGEGVDGTVLPIAQELIGDPAMFSGIYALEKVDLFNILCIPDATRAKPSAPDQPDLSRSDQNSVFSEAIKYCSDRRAFLLIDAPPEVCDVDKASDWKSLGLTANDPSGHGAAYFPRLRLPDPLNNSQLRTFAPCGVIAGLYARIDAARGVWKAPAGTEATLAGVQGMVYKLTDAENGVLNPLGLNCLRTFPVYGSVCWGARTLAGADAAANDDWKYVSVRRTALFIEESLYRGTKWVVFEPNDEPLWAQIRLNIGAFMHGLFRQGAFQGQTPKDAYFVKCDKETTTQTDINLGIVNILVGFAPLKPAEFVIIKIQQMAGQIAT